MDHRSGYCCKLSTWRASSITNNNKFFIAFADSASPMRMNPMIPCRKRLIKNPTGGAIAYLGHTRFSWIGLGDDYQRAFFKKCLNIPGTLACYTEAG